MVEFALVLTAAGSSERFRKDDPSGRKKEYADMDGHPVLYHALKAFLDTPGIRCAVVTVPEGGEEDARDALGELSTGTVPVHFVKGGSTRTQSVRNGVMYLSSLPQDFSLIAVHDGARPFVSPSLIQSVNEAASAYGGAAPGLKVVDAVKRVDRNGLVTENADRTNLVRVQTPQVFSAALLEEIYASIGEDESYPDDIELYTTHGGQCILVDGDERNVKITYARDLEGRR